MPSARVEELTLGVERSRLDFVRIRFLIFNGSDSFIDAERMNAWRDRKLRLMEFHEEGV